MLSNFEIARNAVHLEVSDQKVLWGTQCFRWSLALKIKK